MGDGVITTAISELDERLKVDAGSQRRKKINLLKKTVNKYKKDGKGGPNLPLVANLPKMRVSMPPSPPVTAPPSPSRMTSATLGTPVGVPLGSKKTTKKPHKSTRASGGIGLRGLKRIKLKSLVSRSALAGKRSKFKPIRF